MRTKVSPLLKLATDAITDVKGLDLKVLDVRSTTPMMDHLVVCTGTSNRHVKSIAENVIARAKEAGVRPRGIEGLGAGEWVLVDLVDVVVHVMQAQTRAFYQLEKLWDVPAAAAPEAPKAPKAKKPSRKKAAAPRRKADKARGERGGKRKRR